jgi:acyl-coenzyme A synthetase/AMP-(fatty) acid ligase
MMASETRLSYDLHFSSSEYSPLALTNGTAISLGQFRNDVLKNCDHLPEGNGKVLINCHGRYAFSVALLASWLAGKTVILPPNTLDETLDVIRSQGSLAYEFDSTWSTALLDGKSEIVHGDWPVSLENFDNALELFTSGSTGKSKIIVKSIANLFDEVITLRDQFDWPNGPITGSVPPTHLYGLTFTVLLPWILHTPWIDDIPLFPSDITRILKNSASQTLISVPTQYKALLQDHADLSQITCISAAAPLPAELATKWKQRFGSEILEIYGSTETGVIGYRKQVSVSAWKAFPNVRLEAEAGILKVCSPFVSHTWKNGYLTADKVILENATTFQLLGRADSIVKIAGKRISLTKIENGLLSCPGVVEAAVIAVPEKGYVRDNAIWAAVIGKQEHPLSARQLQADLRGKLESIEIPRRIVIVDKLPHTANGKLPLTAIKKLFGRGKPQRV